MLLIRRGGVEAASYTASQSQLTTSNSSERIEQSTTAANFEVFVNP